MEYIMYNTSNRQNDQGPFGDHRAEGRRKLPSKLHTQLRQKKTCSKIFISY